VLLRSILLSAVIGGVLRVLPLGSLAKWLVASLPPGMASQKMLNHMMAPPPMKVGTLYASAYKLFVMGLVVGQLTPLAYLVAALAFVLEFWTNKYALCRLWARPPTFDERITGTLCHRMRGTVLIAVTVRFFALLGANASLYALVPSLVAFGYVAKTLAPSALSFIRGGDTGEAAIEAEAPRFFKGAVSAADRTQVKDEQ
jgi:hypothetical protein